MADAMTLQDTHCHFFSRRFFEALAREKYGATGTVERVALELGWDLPGTPEALAERWIAELDRQHVSRVALIASVPGDEDSVAAAVATYPARFVGFFMLNASASGAPAFSMKKPTNRVRSGNLDSVAPACFRRCTGIGWTMSAWRKCSRSPPRTAGPSSRTAVTCRSARA